MAKNNAETSRKQTNITKEDCSALAKENDLLPVAAADSHGFQNDVLHEKLTLIFMTIGIPPHINGYHFLREAVKLAAGNFDMINNITKKLYPLVAKHFNTTASTVEQGIRNAITVMWSRGKPCNINDLFGLSVYEQNNKPSNGELIALLAEKVYLDCNCNCTAGMM